MSLGLDKERPEKAELPDESRKKLLCVDCAHHSRIDPGGLLDLVHVCSVEGLFDQVDGKPIYRKCSAARNNPDICGPYATKFKPNQK